jgi:hypothetical protein
LRPIKDGKFPEKASDDGIVFLLITNKGLFVEGHSEVLLLINFLHDELRTRRFFCWTVVPLEVIKWGG